MDNILRRISITCIVISLLCHVTLAVDDVTLSEQHRSHNHVSRMQMQISHISRLFCHYYFKKIIYPRY